MPQTQAPFQLHIDTDPLRALRAELGLARIAEAEYFEYRLGTSQEQVDYLFAIPRRRAALARQVALESWRRGALSHPAVWRSLARLFEAWARGGSLLSSNSPAIRLEFDQLCSPTPQLSAPSVSVCLVPGYRTDEPLSTGSASSARALVADVLERLELEHNAALAEQIAGCFSAVTERGRWIHLSVMLGRVPSAVKLYGSISRASVLPVLRDIGWHGELGAIAAALDGPYAAGLVGDELLIDLNLDNYRDPERASLGLAIGRQQVLRGPCGERTCARALSAWVAAGLATPERAAVAEGWAKDGAEEQRHFIDLKLVWQAGIGFGAKAYLGRHSVRVEQLTRFPEQWGLSG